MTADPQEPGSERRIRRSQHSRAGGQSRGQIVDAFSIRERPAEIEDRAIPGHWEGHLIGDTKNSHIVTLGERHSRFTALVKVPSRDTAVVVAALSRHVGKLPASLRRTRIVGSTTLSASELSVGDSYFSFSYAGVVLYDIAA